VYINVKKQSLYTSVIDSHIENSKNWNSEFSCGVRRQCDDDENRRNPTNVLVDCKVGIKEIRYSYIISNIVMCKTRPYNVWFLSAINRQLALPGATNEVSFKKSIKHERTEFYYKTSISCTRYI